MPGPKPLQLLFHSIRMLLAKFFPPFPPCLTPRKSTQVISYNSPAYSLYNSSTYHLYNYSACNIYWALLLWAFMLRMILRRWLIMWVKSMNEPAIR